MNLDLPMFEDLSSSELDACLNDLDQALDNAFLGDLEVALDRASSAGAYDPAPASMGGSAA